MHQLVLRLRRRCIDGCVLSLLACCWALRGGLSISARSKAGLARTLRLLRCLVLGLKHARHHVFLRERRKLRVTVLLLGLFARVWLVVVLVIEVLLDDGCGAGARSVELVARGSRALVAAISACVDVDLFFLFVEDACWLHCYGRGRQFVLMVL